MGLPPLAKTLTLLSPVMLPAPRTLASSLALVLPSQAYRCRREKEGQEDTAVLGNVRKSIPFQMKI